jgi:hypothetical protein
VTTERDEALYWANQAVLAHRDMATSVRASAGKWQAAIIAYLGAYATVNFVIGPTTLATLPVSGWQQDAILAAMCLAGLVAVAAVVLANMAAQGLPNVHENDTLTGQRLAKLTLSGAKQARRQLDRAIVLAAAAGALAVVAAMSILAAAVLATKPPPNAVLQTRTESYCGSIATADGIASLKLSSGQFVPVDGGKLTLVSSCGI